MTVLVHLVRCRDVLFLSSIFEILKLIFLNDISDLPSCQGQLTGGDSCRPRTLRRCRLRTCPLAWAGRCASQHDHRTLLVERTEVRTSQHCTDFHWSGQSCCSSRRCRRHSWASPSHPPRPRSSGRRWSRGARERCSPHTEPGPHSRS